MGTHMTDIIFGSDEESLRIHKFTLTDAKNERTRNRWHLSQDYTFIARLSAIIYKGLVSLQKKYELCKVISKNYIREVEFERGELLDKY